jgi:hypothetical protein
LRAMSVKMRAISSKGFTSQSIAPRLCRRELTRAWNSHFLLRRRCECERWCPRPWSSS